MNIHSDNVTEVANRHFLIGEALRLGFLTFVPVYDAGIDIMLYREADRRSFAVQIKSRWTIHRKYENRNIWIAFPDRGEWYLRRHDDMVAAAPDHFKVSKAWLENGAYTVQPLSASMREGLSSHRFAQVLSAGPSARRTSIDRTDRSRSVTDRVADHRAKFATGQPPLGVDGILSLRGEGRRC